MNWLKLLTKKLQKKPKVRMVEIQRRTDVPREGIWFTLKIDGLEYSLMNCGELLKTHPFPEGLFGGWETLRNTKDEQEIIRADSLGQLLDKLHALD